MKPLPPNAPEQRLRAMISCLNEVLGGDPRAKLSLSGQDDALDELGKGINTLIELLRARRQHELATAERLAELTDCLVAIAALNFDSLPPLRRDGGSLDTVAVGLRMVAEELQASTVSNDYVHKIIDSMADVLIVTQPDGEIRTVNQAACRVTGRSEQELLGTDLASLLVREAGESERPLLKRLTEEGEIRNLDVTFKPESDEHVPMQANGSVLRGADGRVTSIILVARDMRETQRRLAAEAATVAERERAEELKQAYDELRDTQVMLVQTAKLTALGELAAGVAHELNQPLNNIKLIAQGILRDVEHDRYDLSTLIDDGRDIIRIVDKMAGIVNHVRTFARKPERSLRVDVDVNNAIQNGLKMLREQLRLHGIELREELAPDLAKIKGDPNNIEQVILNLLTNARDAVLKRMHDDPDCAGVVSVRSFTQNEHELCLEVEDNGEGISPNVKEKLFEPFFTTKERGQGTGLGLPIAQRVTLEYGGHIEVESEPGRGATFRVFLPTATD